ncbi:hypothetical protein [Staphylococcus shinii]|uniref:hypothetical protein n=1 Tax=Staphylococcus shinii TaxID=2912228 RepID=UPI003EEFADC9
MNFDLAEVETSIEKLLSSHLTLKEISNNTGVSESILKKLSSGEQSISNAKFATVESLYSCYLENNESINNFINEGEDLKHIKLPKKVLGLIEDIDKTIQYMQHDKKLSLKVDVKDVYKVGREGEVSLLEKLISINDIIGLGVKEEGEYLTAKEPYRLIVNTKIDKSITKLRDFTVRFDKQKLIYTLKKLKNEGNQIYIVNTKECTKNIGVYFKKGNENQYINTNYGYIEGFESEFFYIEYI